MKRREFLGLVGGVIARPFATRPPHSMPAIAAFAAAVIFMLNPTIAEAETPSLKIGLVTCDAWLSNPGYARDGENWVYGFWDGLVQGLGHPNRIGQLPNLDLMLDDVRSNCRGKPSSTLAESASLTFERARQGAFSAPPPGK
jgi:hypothetical protein